MRQRICKASEQLNTLTSSWNGWKRTEYVRVMVENRIERRRVE
jgi:hypothetical protein